MKTQNLTDFMPDQIIPGADYRNRREKWVGIVIHHTSVGGRKEISPSLWQKLYSGVVNWLSKKDANYVSSHYVIAHDGKVTQIIDPDKHVAFHAGKSSFWDPYERVWRTNCNNWMLGVELVGDGNLHMYSNEQYDSLIRLCRHLIGRFPEISPLCIVGHETVSPGRKVDPGKHFDWERLYDGIYG